MADGPSAAPIKLPQLACRKESTSSGVQKHAIIRYTSLEALVAKLIAYCVPDNAELSTKAVSRRHA
jgi:hypothetical protein